MELRAYFFGNMYLSSIQQGIQTAHVIAEMFNRYRTDNKQKQLLYEWANNHKTMILLNAGYGQEIRDLLQFFTTAENPYPYSQFNESEEALDSAITSVGIILPDTIYNASEQVRKNHLMPESIRDTGIVKYLNFLSDNTINTVSYEVTKWEYEMILRLNNYGLAR